MGFKDQMQEHDEQFEADKEAGALPDGTYSPATVTEARVEEDDGVYTMVWRFEADYDLNGNQVHGSIRKWWNDIANPDNAQGRQFLAKDMKRVGYEGAASDLEDACEQEVFIGLECEIVVKTKAGKGDRDYTNVYINRLAPGSRTAGGEPVTAPTGARKDPDDDIPF